MSTTAGAASAALEPSLEEKSRRKSPLRSSSRNPLRRSNSPSPGIGSIFGSRSNSRRIPLGEYGGAIAQRSVGGASPMSFLFRRSRSQPISPAPDAALADGTRQQNMAALLAARRKSKPCYIIDPRRSKSMQVWDIVTTLCLIFTALVTPYEVAFLEMPRTWSDAWNDPLFVINRFIDLVFITDMTLQFDLMYQDQNRLDGVKWIDEPSQIFNNYVKGW